MVHVQIGHDDQPNAWQYEIHFAQDHQRRPILRKERIQRQGELLLDRPDAQDHDDIERLTQTYLEQVNVNKEFRVIADFFAQIRYLHIVPQLIREPDRSVGRVNDPFGGDFLEQLARTSEKTRTARLKRIQEALQVAVPQLRELTLWRDPRGTPHLRGRYEHWRAKGAWQNEDHFLDGTLRLMGLLWAILEGSGSLLLEEPEWALHPEVIRHIPSMFARMQRRAGRQVLVSTHSADLLNDEGIGLDEVFLLQPVQEGTDVRSVANNTGARDLVLSGVPLADVVLSRTRPAHAEQLALFGD